MWVDIGVEANLKKNFPGRKTNPDPYWSKGDVSAWKELVKRFNDGVKPE